MPGPTFICLACSATPWVTSSKALFSTYSRDPAEQTWPWLKKIALAAPGIARSMSASANTTFGDLPPSSSVTFFRLPLAASMIRLPTAVEPVKAILSTSGCAARASPASPPAPERR